MLVVMPKSGTADAFEATFDGAALDEVVTAMQLRAVDVTMPKLSFGSSASLKQTLSTLGMVDEAGTEAAAATAVVVGNSSASSGTFLDPAAIVVDHPFFFFIRDVPTGAILFAGRVNDPSAH